MLLEINVGGVKAIDSEKIENPKLRKVIKLRMERPEFMFGWNQYREGSHGTWSQYSERTYSEHYHDSRR